MSTSSTNQEPQTAITGHGAVHDVRTILMWVEGLAKAEGDTEFLGNMFNTKAKTMPKRSGAETLDVDGKPWARQGFAIAFSVLWQHSDAWPHRVTVELHPNKNSSLLLGVLKMSSQEVFESMTSLYRQWSHARGTGNVIPFPDLILQHNDRYYGVTASRLETDRFRCKIVLVKASDNSSSKNSTGQSLGSQGSVISWNGKESQSGSKEDSASPSFLSIAENGSLCFTQPTELESQSAMPSSIDAVTIATATLKVTLQEPGGTRTIEFPGAAISIPTEPSDTYMNRLSEAISQLRASLAIDDGKGIEETLQSLEPSNDESQGTQESK